MTISEAATTSASPLASRDGESNPVATHRFAFESTIRSVHSRQIRLTASLSIEFSPELMKVAIYNRASM
jgi:hypothetical protein